MRTFEINRGKFVEVIEMGDDSPALVVIDELEKQLAAVTRERDEALESHREYSRVMNNNTGRTHLREEALRPQLLAASAENLMLRSALEKSAHDQKCQWCFADENPCTCHKSALSTPPSELAAALGEMPDFIEHLLAMDALTPGGSNEGWAKRLLSRVQAAMGGSK